MTLIRRIDRNWYEGRIGHRKGIFPASYVEVAQEPTGPGNERGEQEIHSWETRVSIVLCTSKY